MTSLVDPCDVKGKWRGHFESVPGAGFTLDVRIDVNPVDSTLQLGFFAKVGNNIGGGAEGRIESGKGVVITNASNQFSMTEKGCEPDVLRVESLVMSMLSNLKLLARVSRTELSATYEEQGIPTTMILTQGEEEDVEIDEAAEEAHMYENVIL